MINCQDLLTFNKTLGGAMTPISSTLLFLFWVTVVQGEVQTQLQPIHIRV